MASLPHPDPAPECAIDASANRRGAERLAVLLPGTLTTLDGEFECAIEDISRTGARIVTDATLREGRECVLACSPLDELCMVAWTEGQAAGLEFTDEAALGTIRMLRWHNDRYHGQNAAAVGRMLRGWVEDGAG